MYSRADVRILTKAAWESLIDRGLDRIAPDRSRSTEERIKDFLYGSGAAGVLGEAGVLPMRAFHGTPMTEENIAALVGKAREAGSSIERDDIRAPGKGGTSSPLELTGKARPLLSYKNRVEAAFGTPGPRYRSGTIQPAHAVTMDSASALNALRERYAGTEQRLREAGKFTPEMEKAVRTVSGLTIDDLKPEIEVRNRKGAIQVKGDSALETLAHELGHSVAGPKVVDVSTPLRRVLAGMRQGRHALNYLEFPAVTTAAMADNPYVGAAAAAAPGVLGAPALINEIRASLKGAKLLQSAGHKGLGAFVGVPSYAATALSPWAAYMVKRMRMRGKTE